LRVTPLPTRKPKNLRPTPVVIEVKPVKTSSAGGAPAAANGDAAGTKKIEGKTLSDRNRQQGGQR
jgi:hypothetical protein